MHLINFLGLRRLAAFWLMVTVAFSAQAAQVRLNAIAAVRFTTHEGQHQIERGLFDSFGHLTVTSHNVIAQDPGPARDKILVYTEAWFAYLELGENALANFERPSGQPFSIGGLVYYEVAPSPHARFDLGDVVNLSSRGRVEADAGASLVGGFVIEGQARRVLIRAVGPGLVPHGVSDAVSDPYLSLYQRNTVLYYNDNWNERPEAAEIVETAAALGAFPLATGSRDAALLIELPPGAYTAQVTTASGAPGPGLLEIYLVP